MDRIKILTSIFLLAISSLSYAQEWTYHYDGMFNGAYGVNCLGKAGNYIYAGLTDFSGPTNNALLYRSSDNGMNWFPMNIPQTSPEVSSIYSDGTNIYAGFEGGGLFRSSNNGQNWEYLRYGTIEAIIKSGTNLLLSDLYTTVYYSTDNGINWQPSLNWPQYTQCYCLTEFNGKLFGGSSMGIQMSTDNGISWTQSGLYGNVIRSLYEFQGSLYAGCDSVYKSTNGGTNWILASSGIIDPPVFTFTSVNNLLLCGTFNGTYRTTNGGSNWSACYAGLGPNQISSLLLSGDKIYAGVGFSGYELHYGLFSSSNSGLNWQKTGFNTFNITDMILKDTTIFVATDSAGLFASKNEGIVWVPCRNELNRNYVSSLSTSGYYIFAGTSDSGVYRSSNNGNNWIRSNNGLNNLQIKSFHYKDSVLYAGTGSGIFKSTNDGLNWNLLGLTATIVNSVYKENNTVFAGCSGGICISTNNGINWTTGILSGKNVKAFYRFHNNLYCGTNTGLYISSDNGITWGQNALSSYSVNSFTNFADTLSCSTIHGVYASTDNGYSWIWLGPKNSSGYFKNVLYYRGNLYSGGMYGYNASMTGCIWKRAATIATVIKKPNNESVTKFELSQNYPNPFNPTTNITYFVAKKCSVNITVYDNNGRKIKTLVDELKHPGIYSLIFNASHIPSGIYFYKITTPEYSKTKKMVLIR